MPSLPASTLRAVFPALPYWHALTLPQRQAILALSFSFQAPVHALRALPPQLLESLFEVDGQGRARPNEALRALIGFIHRLAEWSHKGVVNVPVYAKAMSTHAQRHTMTGVKIGSNPLIAQGAFAKRLAAGAFSRALAASETPQAFVKAVGGWIPDGQKFGPGDYRALKDWLARTTRNGNATYAFDAGAFTVTPGPAPADLAALAFGFGLAMPLLLDGNLLPGFGAIAPGQASQQAPENAVRKAAAVHDPFARPFLLDDMETWLRSLRAEPSPVLTDGWNVPVARQRRIGKDLIPLPSFLPEAGFNAEARCTAALWMLYRLDLAEPLEAKRGDWKLTIKGKGEAWLALGRKEKLASIFGWLPIGGRSKAKPYERFAFLGDFPAHDIPMRADSDSIYPWMDAAFAALRSPCEWKPYLESASKRANPFLDEAERDAELAGRWAAWENPPEEAYAKLLSHYAARLCSLGALAFAPGNKGNISVTLSPIGEWLYKRAEIWEMPAPPRAVAIVGADFSVTLLSPDPDARAELAAFCEADGDGYRLTRASVQGAAHRGIAPEAILESLARLSKHALPQNVAHEIGSWAGARRSVRLAEAVLIESDDPLALAELRSAYPKDFEPLSPRVLRYLGAGTRAVLVNRLRKAGLFLEG